MVSTTQRGDHFRDKVFNLLKAAQKKGLSKEKYINGKKVDVYYEDYSLFDSSIKIVIECKNYSKAFDKSLFREIYCDYDPIKSEFDFLLIITKQKPTSSVLDSLQSNKWIKHFTWVEFTTMLMDFSAYLQTLSARFKNEGLENYYVPVKTKDGTDLEYLINAWIRDENDSQARAIFAGYGMGKSSFAKHMAFKLSQDFLEERTQRIPIYLKLGDIYSEQSIDGLLGKHLASENIVPGYNFELFQAMNRNGLLIIILDGFDEMKHAMTIEEFVANKDELNKLVISNSKVIILGRPSAFISSSEYISVVKDECSSDLINISNNRPYKEIEISEFDREQLSAFLPKYLEYENEQSDLINENYRSADFLNKRLRELLQSQFAELISRPVHAKMLCMLAIRNEQQLEQFTRYKLYKSFFEENLKREYEKKARTSLDKESRREFIRWIAWEHWPSKGASGFTYDEIKENPSYKALEGRKGGQDMLRELLVGSILDSKSPGVYYFSHRSFQEYLVAEYVLDRLWTAQTISLLDSKLNIEILYFLQESTRQCEISNRLFNALSDFKGNLSKKFVNFIYQNFDYNEQNFDNGYQNLSPWQIYLLAARGYFVNKIVDYDKPFIDSLPGDLFASLILGITDQEGFGDTEARLIASMLLRKTMPIVDRGLYHKGKLNNQISLRNVAYFGESDRSFRFYPITFFSSFSSLPVLP